MANEELELEESEETSTESNKLEIDFSLDPVERIKLEIENIDDCNAKEIGEYLIEQFANDEVLKNCYKDRKITLDAVNKFVTECAKKQLNNKNGRITDKVVFGWVLHYVQDEPVEITKAETQKITLTKVDKELAKQKALKQYQDEELEKLRKQNQRKIDAENKKREKELAKEKASGQMNLFGDF